MPIQKIVKKRKKSSDFSEDEDDYTNLEAVDTNVNVSTHEDLVGLIEQPAWKTILITLVKSERMDPWNIDIKVLAEKYLQKIRSLNSTDLRLPANAILASAILLKFKARALRLPSLEEDEELRIKSLMTEEELLGGMMPELISPNLVREGKVSLDMLVQSIEEILDKTKSKVLRERDGRDRPVFNLPFAGLNMEAKMKEFLELSRARADETGLTRFSTIVHGRETNEVVEYFLALLFLINQKELSAWQESLFGEIFVSVFPRDEKEGEESPAEDVSV
jgi:segregation and condensation protein A